MLNLSLLVEQLDAAEIPYEGCDSNGIIVFLPEATQQNRDDAATIVSNLSPTEESDAERLKRLKSLAKSDALKQFTRRMIAANGSPAVLLELYNDARDYETQHPDLQAMMQSEATLFEVANSVTVNLSLDADKAAYLNVFRIALLTIVAGE